jgi:predicted amidohydrolase
MAGKLKLSLIQTDLVWQQPAANRAKFADHISSLPSTDLILLPEMFTTGFTMDAARFAESMDGPTVRWMADMAQKAGAVVTGSLIIGDQGQYHNRLIWMRPDGDFDSYDKRHLFRMAGEEKFYQPGKTRHIFNLQGWRILPQICYDLRFPVWSRNTSGYDLIILVANWPAKRRYAWQALLKARAIENLCFVAAVNRIGADGDGVHHAGDSTVLNFHGEEMVTGAETELITTLVLDKSSLNKYRGRFPFHLDGDSFQIV